MFAEFTENAAEKVSDKITCESCGVEFSCGANVGKCWCFAVEMKAETLAELREDFNHCLCEDCLSKFSKEIFTKFV
ncbi:MAG: cysteine-rich CWC family protein [Pyrinomonadaceae bacterium]|nr:cysteine-rich CWC family protein [Pyrinomonadaceae bacterium]